jgi:hypothetical protein
MDLRVDPDGLAATREPIDARSSGSAQALPRRLQAPSADAGLCSLSDAESRVGNGYDLELDHQ